MWHLKCVTFIMVNSMTVTLWNCGLKRMRSGLNGRFTSMIYHDRLSRHAIDTVRISCCTPLTSRYSWPHDKEHPHCNPFEGGGQQASAFEDGVHHFVLKGDQHENKHCVEHCQPSGREAERDLPGIQRGGKKTREYVQEVQNMKNNRKCQCSRVQCFRGERGCADGLDTVLAPSGGQN